MTNYHSPVRAGIAFSLLTLFYISFMFLPRLMPAGMFGDGLLYASIARNLAEVKGQLWNPFFSSGYWIDGVSPRGYFENPPLMFWMQSILFYVLGDYWWIEKLYSFLLLLANCFLITCVWEVFLKGKSETAGKFSWLPVLFFYLIPVVVWGSPQNLIDSQLLTFCLLALWSIFKGLRHPSKSKRWYAAAIIFMFCGILVKGPVALYPVCVPALYAVVFHPAQWRKGMMRSSGLLLGVLILFSWLLWWYEPAFNFFRQYWSQRLEVAIVGGRADGLREGWERLYIFWLLLRENSLILSVSLILFFISWKKGITYKGFSHERKLAIFFFMIGLAATVPVMMSTRQAGMYLIPGLVLFAMAAGYLHIPLLTLWMRSMKAPVVSRISALAIVGFLMVLVHSALKFGEPGREQSLLNDMPHMEKMIPAGSKVAVCKDVMGNFVYHVYLQRYLKMELTRETAGAKYFLCKAACGKIHDSEIQSAGFEKEYDGNLLGIYTRQ